MVELVRLMSDARHYTWWKSLQRLILLQLLSVFKQMVPGLLLLCESLSSNTINEPLQNWSSAALPCLQQKWLALKLKCHLHTIKKSPPYSFPMSVC